ncbi:MULTISPECIES: tetratricopeptide repeat protein [unclassified Saccharopolyspora]|uniref:AfsR/SARP family transcriptional regulator n=1 Tax=unclassified Saccharopolyspora TaxID=2646250 RepID=UPI001CD3AE7F|nr:MULTISPECIES: tetratricopeptide repeat protein [unclassified Saccharopolyspora]MCA1194847.1 tetratricopeptide repeat protein [Saccharopolyspora sp. 6V]MCA1228130.1 tetratricopeptide repeat protein [Saccharopolyspora sp. 6M]
MDFKICGSVWVRLAGEAPQGWRQSAKVRGLLGVLLTRPGRTIRVPALVDWLWGQEADPVKASKSLTNYVTRLRQVLELTDPPYELRHIDHGYRLDVPADRIDYHRARDLLAAGRSALRDRDHERARGLLHEALELSNEPPILDLDTAAAQEFRHKVRKNLVLPAINGLAESQLALGEPEAVLLHLDDLSVEYELEVTLAMRRVDALHAMHRRDEATLHYFVTRRNLREHGLEDEADALRAYMNRQQALVPEPRREGDSAPQHRDPVWRFPHDRERLAGRERVIADLSRMTDHGLAAKIVVLTGTAGIGKTALALHWAYRSRDRFDGGLYVDMRGFARAPRMESAELIRRLLQGFNAHAEALTDEEMQRTKLATVLTGRHSLILLDNVADEDQIAPLLDLVPDSLLLITSRRRLAHLAVHWSAEEVAVTTVHTETAHAWLRESIGDRCDVEPEALTRLVGLCSGIPLALRLLSKHIEDRPRTPLAEIAHFLAKEHRMLSMGESAGAGHSSLRANFLLSYRALRPKACRLFRLLGLHPLPEVSLDVIVAMTGDSRPDTLDLIEELIQANLLDDRSGSVHIHDLLHEFAAEQADADEPMVERRAATARMIEWYLNCATSAERVLFKHRPGVPPLLAPVLRPGREFADEREAIRWFVDNHRVLVAIVRAAHDRGFPHHTWRLANTLNEPFKRHGQYNDALTCLGLARASTMSVSDREGLIGTIINLGYNQLMLRDLERAQENFTEARSLCRQLDDHHGLAVALHNLASVRGHLGDVEGATRLYGEAREVAIEHHLDHVHAGVLRRMGRLAKECGDPREASRQFRESLFLHRKVGNVQGIGEALSEIGALHADRGELETALDYGNEALEHNLRCHDLATLAETYCLLAQIGLKQMRLRDAAQLARESIGVTWKTGDLPCRARALDLLATILLEAGSEGEAVEGWREALEIHKGLKDRRWVTLRDRLKGLGVEDI